MKLKIIKDSNPIMRKKSLPVEMPLSTEDKKRLQSFYTEVEYDYLYNYEYDLGRISLKKQNLSL